GTGAPAARAGAHVGGLRARRGPVGRPRRGAARQRRRPERMTLRRLAAGAALAAPAALAAVVAAQVAAVVGGEYLPDPAYRVDAVREPPVAAARRPLRLAVLGDSTVAGIGAAQADDALPVLVAERVAPALGCRVVVTGFGVSGARTADV